MNDSERSLIRAIRGPVVLITVGVLFVLNNFTPYGFGETWPVLLIVFGLFSLLQRGGGRPPAQRGQPWPPRTGAQAGPSYRQSTYQGQDPGGGR